MAIGNFEEASSIVPNPDGTGNDVQLKALPYFEETDKFTGVRFPFIDKIESEYSHGHFDPFGADTEKRKASGFARLLHLYGALMPKESYKTLCEYDESNDSTIEAFVTFANGLLAPDALEVPLRILIAYSKKGYVTMPAYGDVISSIYKPKVLQWVPASNTTLKPVEKKMDDEMGGNDGNNM